MAAALWTLLLLAQLLALGTLSRRLARGRHRLPRAEPRADDAGPPRVSVVVPARNERHRIGACLAGLARQGPTMLEALVVDGGSTDGTPELVRSNAARDARLRLLAEPPRPPGAVGRPWAIAAGCAAARGEWVLVVDADVAPAAGMVAGALLAAERHGFDAVSFAPSIRAPGAGARLLQPAFLATLVYRFGPAGLGADDAERAVANGQCLLVRRATLERHGGYAPAVDSYCDDVRIVRHLGAAGARVAFLDGPALLEVTMYPTARETWRAWPRSLNMRDATTDAWRWLDCLFLVLALALPLPLALLLVLAPGSVAPEVRAPLLATNLVLLLLRALLLVASRHSFAPRGAAYWLSPLADLPAALRVVATALQRPREWRGAPATGTESRDLARAG